MDGDPKDGLRAASAVVTELQSTIAEALAQEASSGCGPLVVRALTQLSHAERNLRKSAVCLELPEVMRESFAESKRQSAGPARAAPEVVGDFSQVPPWDAPV